MRRRAFPAATSNISTLRGLWFRLPTRWTFCPILAKNEPSAQNFDERLIAGFQFALPIPAPKEATAAIENT
jgi:hypothetical protein